LEKHAIRGKRRARKLAVQALYQWLMSHNALSDIEAQCRLLGSFDKVDADYFTSLLYGIPKHVQELEQSFAPFVVDRSIEEINPIELTILRVASFELKYRPDLPYKVILDEAVSLTKEFGSQDGYRYVNGVLNGLARKDRAIEVKLDKEAGCKQPR
jgi:N utilization substance protein B